MSCNPSIRRTLLAIGASVAVAAVTTLSGCTHRSVQEVEGSLAIPDGIRSIRLEVDNGTLDIGGVDTANPSKDVVYEGGVRRDGATAEDLARIEALTPGLVAAPDPDDASVLVVRGPAVPAGTTGVIALECGIRIPESLPLEVVVRGNGHVTAVGRRARTEVRTRRGDLRFDDCHGGVEAKTGQGVVIVYAHRGDVDVRTGLGDMQAFVDEPGEVLTLTTGKGTVQCNVPEDLGFVVDARAEIGRIGSDFGLEARRVGDYSAALTGRHGDGRTKILLRTASGHIDLIGR